MIKRNYTPDNKPAREVVFDPCIFDSPFAMKELILRGYRIIPMAPYSPHEQLNQDSPGRNAELITERRQGMPNARVQGH